MKRTICLLLALLLMLSLAACDSDNPAGTTPDNNQTQGNGGTTTNTPNEPELVMPDAPTESLSMMEYHAAYETLQDVTASVEAWFYGFPSTTAVTTNSVTEFSKQEQADTFFSDFANVGYVGDISFTVTEGYRNFFLANTEYSAQLPVIAKKVMYHAETDTLYVMLEHYQHPYVEDLSKDYAADIANNAVASYHMVQFKSDEYANAQHIVFVSPEKKELCRSDINVTVISYDAQYQSLPFFDWQNKGVALSTHSYPSTKVPTANKVDLIPDAAAFMNFQEQYNDIVTRDEDWLIYEPGFIFYNHRFNSYALEEAAETGALLNILVSSPELDAQSSLRTGSFWIPTGEKNADGTDKKYLCGQFYDEATQTVYIYLEYNGQPHTQYEAWSDEAAIQENSKATYAMMSIEFHEDAQAKVKNVVIVLPDPATVPAN